MSTATTRPSRTGFILLAIAGVLIVLNLAVSVVDRWVGGARSGPPSSTFTTDANGLAAYADLLEREGVTVTKLRRPLAEATLDPASVLVVLDSQLDDEDTRSVRAFVEAGGRLVAGGGQSEWLHAIVGDVLVLKPASVGVASPTAPVATVAGVRRVVSPGEGAFADPGPALPALAGSGGILLAVIPVGSGNVALLSSASPLQNESLDEADNAALGLSLAARGPVVFAEQPHGFGEDQGFWAIPSRARWALAGLALAAVVWMIGRARRLGPPEQASRALAPSRRLYVEAIGATLARTKRRAESVAPLQRAARERVSRLTGVPIDAGEDAMRDAAIRAGLSAEEAAAIVVPPTDDAGVVASGRAFAVLRRDKRR